MTRRKPGPLDNAKPSCEGCVYFTKSDDEGETEVTGACRRNPPNVLIDGDGDPVTCFPYMTGSEWCGEFRPKQ